MSGSHPVKQSLLQETELVLSLVKRHCTSHI